MKKFICPLPFLSLSFDSGQRARVCCHTDEPTEIFSDLELTNRYNKAIAKQMLDGEIPKACQGCFKNEEQFGHSVRLEYLNEFSEFENIEDERVRYLDITLDNPCNLGCLSCRPKYSSFLEKEFKSLSIPMEVSKPFDIGFYKNIIENKLITGGRVTISGGEPTINRNFKELLNTLKDKSIKLRVFTNTTQDMTWVEKYIDRFEQIEVICSIDASGELYEFVRFPGKWSVIIDNLRYLNNLTTKYSSLSLGIHTVVSAVSVFGIVDLLKELKITLKKDFIPSFTFLSFPLVLSVNNLSRESRQKIKEEILEYIALIDKDELTPLSSLHLEELSQYAKGLDKLEQRDFLSLIVYLKKFSSLRGVKIPKVIIDN